MMINFHNSLCLAPHLPVTWEAANDCNGHLTDILLTHLPAYQEQFPFSSPPYTALAVTLDTLIDRSEHLTNGSPQIYNP